MDVKVALLAGGLGTRLSEETTVRPKPMVEVGGRPIMWHIMKIYAQHGLRDFVVLGGYKVEFIKNYFLNYFAGHSDFTVDMRTGQVEWLRSQTEDWRVTVLDTGHDTMTGGRLRRARHVLGGGPFCLTYGDGVSDIDITALIAAHRRSKGWCTLTAVTQPGRYGSLRISPDSGNDLGRITGFREKGARDGGLINGGFFVCEPEVLDLIDDDNTVWEEEPMTRLVSRGRLNAYHHDGYWQSMDSLRDKQVLEGLWRQGAPWKTWND